MKTSEYQQSLDCLLKVFTTFHNVTINWLKAKPQGSNDLQDTLSIWLHPKGISNLIKTITLESYIQPFFQQGQIGQQDQSSIQEGSSCEVLNQDEFEKNLRKADSLKKYHQKAQIVEISSIEEDENQSKDSFSFSRKQVNESSYNQSDERTYKRGPYRNYSMQEKLKAVQLFGNQSMCTREISRILGIPVKNITRWATEGVVKKRGGGRKRANPMLEENVYKWMVSQHPYGEHIHIEQIQEYALSRNRDRSFKASRGWAVKFIQRYNLRSRYIIK